MQTTSEKINITKALQGFKLLLVEDNPDIQLLVGRGLKYLGALLDFASDGREAMDKALSHNYDVILMDIQMPGLDGLEATKLLREKNYTKPIIALTAHAQMEEKERILKFGFDDYVIKPLDRQVLIKAILNVTSLNAATP